MSTGLAVGIPLIKLWEISGAPKVYPFAEPSLIAEFEVYYSRSSTGSITTPTNCNNATVKLCLSTYGSTRYKLFPRYGAKLEDF